jgi:hypothetical protein
MDNRKNPKSNRISLILMKKLLNNNNNPMNTNLNKSLNISKKPNNN